MADWAQLGAESEAWSCRSDERLLSELQKLSAWLLDSFAGAEQKVMGLEKLCQDVQGRMTEAELAFDRLAQRKAVIQASSQD